MDLGGRAREAGPGLVAFCGYHLLALLGNALLAGSCLLIALVASGAAVEFAEAGYVAAELIGMALGAILNVGALFYGLRLLYRRDPRARTFWTFYLALGLLLYGFWVLQDGGCLAIGALVANLGWLIYWLYSKRAARLHP